MIRFQAILFLLYLYVWKHSAHGTFTRVGNTYMKTPDSCCSIVEGQTAKGCDMTSLHATERVQLAYSPGFPNRFPIGRMCMWTVQCQYGYQVRLEFRDFYLIGPGKNGHCSDQYVMVHSPLTGHSMGRFCGNSGIPTIVSAGNLLVVKLFSEIPISSENFRGFVFVFRETLEAPNPEMRPGNWINHGQFSLNPRGIARELLKLKPTNVPDPNAPSTTTMNNRISAKVMPSDQSSNTNSDKTNSKIPKKKKPIKPKSPNFARPAGPNNGKNFYGNDQNRDIIVKNDIKKDMMLLLPLEVIVAICAGGVCGLALFILIACKINQICRRKTQTSETSSKQTEENEQSKIEEKNEMIAMAPQAFTPENQQQEFPSPSAPQDIDTRFSSPNPFSTEYCTPPMNYPMYCTNSSTMPNSEKSLGTVSTYLSNTHPPMYTPNYEIQPIPNCLFPLPNPVNSLERNNQLLLYDPATGQLYNPIPSQQTLPMSGVVPTTRAQRNYSQQDSDYSDTSSESSSSSDYSRKRRPSKNKSIQKNRKSKRTRQKNSNRRRRRKR